MFDPRQVEIAGIQAVFTFPTVQFYVAGPSDPGWVATYGSGRRAIQLI
jgi:hypothetical protein